jgi:hypothetical protein
VEDGRAAVLLMSPVYHGGLKLAGALRRVSRRPSRRGGLGHTPDRCAQGCGMEANPTRSYGQLRANSLTIPSFGS